MMGRQEEEMGGRETGMFMGSGSAEEAQSPTTKERQLDSAGSVAGVVEMGGRRVRDRRQERLGWGAESIAFARAGVEPSTRD